MNKIDILLNLINLLYRESSLKNVENKINVDLARKIVDTLEDGKRFNVLGGNNDIIDNLKKYVLDMCDNSTEEFDKTIIIQSLSLILKEEEHILEIFKDGLDDIDNDDDINKRIKRLSNFLYNYYKEFRIKKVLNTYSYEFSNKRSQITDVNAFMENLRSEIDGLDLNTDSLDPAIVDEIDFENNDDMNSLIDSIKEEASNVGILKTGWQDINEMVQEGLRRREFVTVGALQHKYKTGFTLSLFIQLCLFNTPNPIHKDKKQLMLWISFEDDVKNIMQFIYNYLYMNENDKLPNIKDVDSKYITSYVKEKLSATGFHVKILRVNPTDWTYKDVFNKIITYETQGYEVNVLGLDYLSMLPTTGCIKDGPMGTDLRDLFRRVRNFGSSRKILTITPHQLSSDSKRLIRNGVPDVEFVKEIAGKGYYSGSTQLDQEIDLELYVHIATNNKVKYLTVQRGKHRLPSTIDEDKMFTMLKFPKRGPIKHDLNGEKNSIRSFSETTSDGFGL